MTGRQAPAEEAVTGAGAFHPFALAQNPNAGALCGNRSATRRSGKQSPFGDFFLWLFVIVVPASRLVKVFLAVKQKL